MRRFLQITASDVNEKFATTHFFIQGINALDLSHGRASEVKQRLRTNIWPFFGRLILHLAPE